MEDTIEHRLGEVEARLEMLEVKVSSSCDRHLSQFVAFSELTRKLVEAQGNSLSIPVLRDVLVPIAMKLFAFFAILVFTILAGIMGIKAVTMDLFR